MEIYKQIGAFFFIFLFLLLIVFLYTQLSVNRKQIKLVNRNNESIAVNAELADNPVKIMIGLMFRSSLGESNGMLFSFNRSDRHGFWMVNTHIPLDAIFFDENRKVVDVIRMEPCNGLSCKTYTPKANARYVLEVNAGFAEKNKIIEGCTFSD
jgi:uncharacterized membrane protein (UPF0127 family)